MNNLFTKLKISVVAGAVSLGTLSLPAYAVNDVLDTPSVPTSIATENLLLDVAKAGDRIVAVGGRGHILFSDDDGQSWTQAAVPVSVLLTGVSFADSQNGWAVGHSGVILKTVDGGQTWKTQFDGNQANKMIITQSERRLAEMSAGLETAAEDDLEDLEYQVEEATFALEDARLDAEVGASKPLLDVLFSSKFEGFAVGAYGYLFKTNNGGETWENYGGRIENPDRFHLNAIAQIKSGALFIVGEAGVVFRSKDAGESWDTIDSPYQGSFFGVTGTGDDNVVLAFGLRGNLYRSDDEGDSWDHVDAGTENTLMSATNDGKGNISIVGNSGSVLLSKDGGRSFSETIRGNRLGNASAVYVHAEKMAVVGENGVNLTSPAGQNL
jgi:photosystem II stability/assembly factor-like uncharacterized protein